jgi:ABC-type nitrate/sulfonate/bicarbonate transport system substrate-binding protein
MSLFTNPNADASRLQSHPTLTSHTPNTIATITAAKTTAARTTKKALTGVFAALLVASMSATSVSAATKGKAKAKPKLKVTAPKATTAPTTPPATVAATVAPTAAPTTAKPVGPSGSTVTAEGISAARCEANKKAGKITYLSGFDYAATASIVEMVVADAKGYFAKMCLDVDVKASFSTVNYALVADNKAQFASSGSYVELVRNTPKERPLVAVYELGKTAIETLMVRDDGKLKNITDLRNKTIGIKGDVPPSIQLMLSKAGLKRGTDYKEQNVDGFNPVAHFSLPIDALPGFKSNEPGQLSRNNPPIPVTTFDPTDYNINGSFGLVYTNTKFVKEHPTAAQDFVRAALKGYQDSAADIDEAVAICVKKINATGNRNFLSPVGEGFRWKVEAKIVADNTPAGTAIGLMNARRFSTQLDEYFDAGILKEKPAVADTFDDSLVKGVYGSDLKVIWPK